MNYGEGGTAPRVNKKTLGAYIGRTVALVGAVESHMPTAVVLRTSAATTAGLLGLLASNTRALSFFRSSRSCILTKVVEVIGRVVDSETIQEFKATLFGENFDLETYDQFVQLAQTKYRGLFD
ncbi:Replication factor a protein 3, partial [Globisporangium splendens]